MVSVVMEGAVVMNSFPPRAVPSTCGQRKESSERDTERSQIHLQHLPPGLTAIPATK